LIKTVPLLQIRCIALPYNDSSLMSVDFKAYVAATALIAPEVREVVETILDTITRGATTQSISRNQHRSLEEFRGGMPNGCHALSLSA